MAPSVTSLSLRRFRSHRALDVRFEPGPVAIFGPNGAGKTNLLEALSLMSPGRGLRRAQAADLAQRPGTAGWRIEAQIAGGPRPHEIVLAAAPGQARTTGIDGKPAPQTGLARLARVLWLTPAMDRLWIEAPEGRRRFLDRLTLGLQPDHAEAALVYDRAMRERNRLLRDGAEDARWYEALEARMAEAGARLQAHRRAALAQLLAAQADARTRFPAADLSLTDPEDAAVPEAEAAFAEALARGRRVDLRAGRSLLGPHRSDLSARYRAKGMSAEQCSTGEQKALLISLVLANARAIAADTGAPPLLLLDEVAAHLDGDRRAALFDELCALGAQAFLTGTGAELFEALGDRAQRLSVTVEGGDSRVAQA